MLLQSAKTHPSKKLKLRKPLVLPEQSSSLKLQLLDDFGLNWVTWENNAPSCNRLICVRCQKFWITETNNPKVGPRQLSYPFIGFVDENLPIETSRTPSKWKEHQTTKYHVIAVDENSKASTRRIDQIFTKKTTPQKDSTNPNLSETSTPSPDSDTALPSFPPADESSPEVVVTVPIRSDICCGAFPPYFFTTETKLGLMYQHLYYRAAPTSTWVVKAADDMTYQVFSTNCTTSQNVCSHNISQSSCRSFSTSIIACRNYQLLGISELKTRSVCRVLSKRCDKISRILSIAKKQFYDFSDRDVLQNFTKTNNNAKSTVVSPSGLILLTNTL